jgi:riboflavin biosynthesis pyrimidine reductase
MRFRQAIPPGPAISPEDGYAGLRLGERAHRERPFVVCNFVSSVDGKATASGRTAPLAGAGDKAAFHLLRTQVDAVLAGTGTLAIERYGALARDEQIEQIRQREGRPAQPLAVVISRSGQIPAEIPMFSDPRSRIVLYAPEVTAVPEAAGHLIVHGGEPPPEDLRSVLASLGRDHDVQSLLFEGGPVLFNALLAEDLVDELFLTISPMIVGGDELGITAGPRLETPLALTLVWAMEHEGNLLLRYAREPAERSIA